MPPARVVESDRARFGPVVTALDRLDAAGREALAEDPRRLWSDANRAGDGTTTVDGAILEVVAVRGRGSA